MKLEPRRCAVCNSTEDVRTYKVVVDDESLRVQPTLCQEHGDRLLIDFGRAIGELLLLGGRPR
jgi:hypothetical protein